MIVSTTMQKKFIDPLIDKNMTLEKQIELLAKGLSDLTEIVVQQQELISEKFKSTETSDEQNDLKDDEVSPAMKGIVERHKAQKDAMTKSDSVKYRGY